MPTNYNDQYYVILRENNNHYPTFNGSLRPRSWRIKEKIEEISEYEVWLTFGLGRKNKQSLYVDYHSSGGDSVCSKEFADFILTLETGGIQFFKGTHGDVVEKIKKDYYMMHVHKRIKCIDRTKSNLHVDPRTDYIKSIRGFSIDPDLLDRIPFEDRRIFFLEESAFIKVFHESIVEKIINTDMKGFRFVKVSQWGDNSAFNKE